MDDIHSRNEVLNVRGLTRPGGGRCGGRMDTVPITKRVYLHLATGSTLIRHETISLRTGEKSKTQFYVSLYQFYDSKTRRVKQRQSLSL